MTISKINATTSSSRRQFLSQCGKLSFSTIAISSLPMASLLTGCNADNFYKIDFVNWAGHITNKQMYAYKPTNESDLLDVINWASGNIYKVRAFGKMHNWSPLVLDDQDANKDTILLIDMSNFSQLSMLEQRSDYGVVSVGAGALLLNLHRFLENQKSVSATGYGFSNIPAIGDISVAGALAIGCHGTSVIYEGSNEEASMFGSLSNKILSLKAIVWNGRKYEVKQFLRNDPDIAPFLTSLGRTIITEFTLQASPSLNMRNVSLFNQHIDTLFAPKQSDDENTIANILDKWGRLDIFWNQLTTNPWVQIWQRADEYTEGSKKTTKPYNPVMLNTFGKAGSDLINGFHKAFPKSIETVGGFYEAGLRLSMQGGLTEEALRAEFTQDPLFLATARTVCPFGAESTADLWGPAWHSSVYMSANALRVHNNGYCVILARKDLQAFMHEYKEFHTALCERYLNAGQFPVTAPVELRFNGLDYTDDLRINNAVEASLSPLAPEASFERTDIAVWMNCMSAEGHPQLWSFYQELEQWILNHSTPKAVRMEWAKGWAYTEEGPWTNEAVLSSVAKRVKQGNGAAEFKRIMNKYDPKRTFTSSFHERLGL